jgi:undecaprenyl diphosphate synthase
MDGNGRWAAQRGLARVEGHRMGVEAVRTSVDACLKFQISILSLFAFSSENWARPTEEVDYLMQLFIESIEREMDALHEKGVRMCFIGDRSRLSSVLQTCMEAVEVLTINNRCLQLNIVINYGGRWDIVQAARTLVGRAVKGELEPDDVDEALFASVLDTKQLPDPDLLIRTSGELRISNFFLWQLAYSELYFTDVFWPDFDGIAFKKALDCYATRGRRFGKTDQQLIENEHV